MLNKAEIKEKLFRLPEQYQTAMEEGRKELAFNIYRKAEAVAVFVELDPADMNKLFGYGQTDEEENPERGLFDREEVRALGFQLTAKKEAQEKRLPSF